MWDAASLNVDSLGNVISNTQQRQLNVTLDFKKLYGKSKYLKKIENGNKPSRSRNSGNRTSRSRAGSSGTKKDKDKDKDKKEREVTNIERALIRPLLSLRNVKLTYRENFGTVVPGIVRNSQILGLDDQFSSPGFGFVSGLQPNIDPTDSNNWLFDGASQGWFTESQFLNQQVLQTRTQTVEGSIDFEIYKDFDIEVDFKKNFSVNHSEEFKNLDGNYQQLILRDMGTIDVSYMAINTLFGFDSNELFDAFEDNRQVISNRLQQRAAESGNPFLEGEHPDDEGFAAGFGRQSTDVLIPAFLATYTGQSPNDVDLSINDRIMALSYIPAPNWTLNYNGLSKLKWFKDIFSSFTVNHGYRSNMRVNSFNSDPDFDALNPFNEVQLQSQNYFTRFDVPQIVISEEFVPVIGINFSTKSQFDFSAEYRKSRNLAMDFYAKELVESKAEEFSIGAGLVLEDVNIPFLTGVKNSKKGSKKKPDPNAPKSSNGTNGKGFGGIGKVTNTQGNNMTFSVDFSYRDDLVQNRTLDQTAGFFPTRGIQSWRTNPAVDYDVNDNVNLRLFFDYSRSIPATTNSFPITNWQTGLTVRLKLGAL